MIETAFYIWLSFIVGGVIGIFLVVFITCLCIVAKRSDERAERLLKEVERDEK